MARGYSTSEFELPGLGLVGELPSGLEIIAIAEDKRDALGGIGMRAKEKALPDNDRQKKKPAHRYPPMRPVQSMARSMRIDVGTDCDKNHSASRCPRQACCGGYCFSAFFAGGFGPSTGASDFR